MSLARVAIAMPVTAAMRPQLARTAVRPLLLRGGANRRRRDGSGCRSSRQPAVVASTAETFLWDVVVDTLGPLIVITFLPFSLAFNVWLVQRICPNLLSSLLLPPGKHDGAAGKASGEDSSE